MKHTDLLKSRAFWAFLNHVADANVNPAADRAEAWPDDVRAAHADFLHEHGDARGVLVQHAVAPHAFDPSASRPGVLVPTAFRGEMELRHTAHLSPYYAPIHPHPGHGPTVEEGDAVTPAYGTSVGDRYETPEAFQINAHTRVHLGVHERPGRPYPHNRMPVVYWRAHIPRTVSSTGLARSASLVSPVPVEALHEFVKRLPPGRTKKVWASTLGGFPQPGQAAPDRLARVAARASGVGQANRAAGSDNHAKRLELARRVLSEAGVAPAAVRNVVLHAGLSSHPAVAAVGSAANEQHALYAAAWVGMLTQAPRGVTVFHPGDGEDTLHILDSPHPADHVASYMRGAGFPSFVTEARGRGTRVFVLNAQDPTSLARGIHAGDPTSLRGRTARIGSSASTDAGTSNAEQAAARAAYRTVIRDAERAAGQAQ